MTAVLFGARAHAQDAVEAQISRGVALRRDGHDDEAQRLFRDVWVSSRSYRALAQMALAEQALGNWVDAEAHLAEALAAATDPWIARNLSPLQESLAEIRGHVSLLDVRCETAGAEVVIAGRVVGITPLRAPLRVPTGAVTFTVRAPGRLPVTRVVQVTAGTPSRESVVLEAAAVAAPVAVPVTPAAAVDASPTSASAEASTPTQRIIGYTLMGVGLAGVATGGVFFGLKEGSVSASASNASWQTYAWENRALGDSDAICAQAQGYSGTVTYAVESREICNTIASQRVAAIGFFVAGGIVATTGIVLALTAPSGAARRAAASVRVVPWLTAREGGVTLFTRW